MVISGFQICKKNTCNKLQVNRSIESIHQPSSDPKFRWFHITNQPKQGQPGNTWRNVFQSLDATTCCDDPKELWTSNLTAIRESKIIFHKILNWNGHYQFLHLFLLAFDVSQNVAYAYAIEFLMCPKDAWLFSPSHPITHEKLGSGWASGAPHVKNPAIVGWSTSLSDTHTHQNKKHRWVCLNPMVI